MHSCITTLLFLLATLSSALLAPSQDLSTLLPPSPPTHQPSTCLTRYSNYWDATENFVLFNSPNETHFAFTLVTKYLKFYPKTLTQWLDVSGFQVVNASTIPDSELCGWLSAASVEMNGRLRGTVGYKYSGNASLRTITPRHHIYNHMNTRPSDQTLRTITAILRANAPDADTYYSMTLLLGSACGILGFVVFSYGLVLTLELNKRMRAAPTDVEDIELDQIKVHDLSGAGMQRMNADPETDGPKCTIEITTPAVAGADTSSSKTSAADPPPIYSLDGVGR
ncbi:hypothetical protein ST47_g9702 [Ascochyta rabiei]|uniref:Uncharacterized protein n=2 Tax=Didymella rabiei TaxID=5454 RepID=A0A162WPX4_DIDRA|nr:hypothetical protein ST47_g9702 [Ascochyta rabiei]